MIDKTRVKSEPSMGEMYYERVLMFPPAWAMESIKMEENHEWNVYEFSLIIDGYIHIIDISMDIPLDTARRMAIANILKNKYDREVRAYYDRLRK